MNADYFVVNVPSSQCYVSTTEMGLEPFLTAGELAGVVIGVMLLAVLVSLFFILTIYGVRRASKGRRQTATINRYYIEHPIN